MLRSTDLDPRSLLRAAVRRARRANTFLALREHHGRMGWWPFVTLLGALVALRVGSIVTLGVAHAGWLLDPVFWVDGTPIAAEHSTPFHGHPNPFGWRFGFQGLVNMHVVTGVGLFAVCLLPLITAKGKPWHVRFGRAFVALWLVHLFNGLANSAQILLVRGFEPTRYPDTVGQGFSLYLYVQFAFISFLVIDFLAHGLAAVHYKDRPPSRAIRAIMLALPLTSAVFGLALVGWAVRHLLSDAPPATAASDEFAVIYLVQVPAYLFLIGKNVAYWARPTPRTWLQGWLTEHQRNMTFCVQVTLYTGLANYTMRHAAWLTPFVFAAIDGGFLVWLLTKERALRRRVIGSRFGLAVAMLLRHGASSPPSRRALGRQDRAWIFGVVDADGSGTVDREEVRALLCAHVATPTESEIDAVYSALDANADGALCPDELAPFLERWFAPPPRDADELAFAFRTFDRDGDGRVSADDLHRALDTGDASRTRRAVDALLAWADTDRSGCLDWSELASAALGPVSRELPR